MAFSDRIWLQWNGIFIERLRNAAKRIVTEWQTTLFSELLQILTSMTSVGVNIMATSCDWAGSDSVSAGEIYGLIYQDF